jgi:hypothetical protein
VDVSFALLLPAYGSYNVIHRMIVHRAGLRRTKGEQDRVLDAVMRLGLVHRGVCALRIVSRHNCRAARIIDVN